MLLKSTSHTSNFIEAILLLVFEDIGQHFSTFTIFKLTFKAFKKSLLVEVSQVQTSAYWISSYSRNSNEAHINSYWELLYSKRLYYLVLDRLKDISLLLIRPIFNIRDAKDKPSYSKVISSVENRETLLDLFKLSLRRDIDDQKFFQKKLFSFLIVKFLLCSYFL